MKSFNRRMKGEAANGDVKYADVVPAVDKIKASLPPWARQAGNNLSAGPQFTAPSGDTLGRAGALFGAIAIVTLVQGYAQPEGVENPTGLEIAAALGATVWFMNNKRVALGASCGVVLRSSSARFHRGWCCARLVARGHRSFRWNLFSFYHSFRVWNLVSLHRCGLSRLITLPQSRANHLIRKRRRAPPSIRMYL